jgi:hypothetical protein
MVLVDQIVILWAAVVVLEGMQVMGALGVTKTLPLPRVPEAAEPEVPMSQARTRFLAEA